MAASSLSLRSPSTEIFTPPRASSEALVAMVLLPSAIVVSVTLPFTTSVVRKRIETLSPSAVTRSMVPRSLRTSLATKRLTDVTSVAAGVVAGGVVEGVVVESPDVPAEVESGLAPSLSSAPASCERNLSMVASMVFASTPRSASFWAALCSDCSSLLSTSSDASVPVASEVESTFMMVPAMLWMLDRCPPCELPPRSESTVARTSWSARSCAEPRNPPAPCVAAASLVPWLVGWHELLLMACMMTVPIARSGAQRFGDVCFGRFDKKLRPSLQKSASRRACGPRARFSGAAYAAPPCGRTVPRPRPAPALFD